MGEKEEKIIVNRNMREWLSALHTRDMPRMLALFAQDAIFLPTFSGQIHVGKEGAKKYFKKFFLLSPVGAVVQNKYNFLGEEAGIYTHGGMYNFFVFIRGRRDLVKARFLWTWAEDRKKNIWEIKSFFSGQLPEAEENGE